MIVPDVSDGLVVGPPVTEQGDFLDRFKRMGVTLLDAQPPAPIIPDRMQASIWRMR